MTAEKVILISYFPFLDNAGGTFTPGSEAAKSALKALRKLDTVVIKGVAWLGEEQSGIATSPCFVVDNAGKLEEHLLWWSENNPKDWFQLIWDKDDSGYTIAVIPTILRTGLTSTRPGRTSSPTSLPPKGHLTKARILHYRGLARQRYSFAMK